MKKYKDIDFWHFFVTFQPVSYLDFVQFGE